ncbi:hypothetical protein MPNT_510004 [Candidatus Methylacidithermus pantelleriae]|uniref:Uncharacterized protein n=1 Tax=Candidatus Methylacidithermus pantelleriae TaxID=2744239 RepID=A0A8J2BS00_9BACT|nr:hypothetical protein MPNT_510004 [Candidatus Methylacidithermus pantelleriae]
MHRPVGPKSSSPGNDCFSQEYPERQLRVTAVAEVALGKRAMGALGRAARVSGEGMRRRMKNQHGGPIWWAVLVPNGPTTAPCGAERETR